MEINDLNPSFFYQLEIDQRHRVTIKIFQH